MTAITIPTIDMLDAHWFTSTLRATGDLADDCAVTSKTSTRIGEAGVMSFLWRVDLTYDGPTTAPKSLIVKSPTDDPHRLFFAQAAKFYAREVRFYRELAPDAPVRTPRCFHAEIDPETSQFLLVLEDVGHLRSVDQLVGCTFDDAAGALRTIAKFQAHWWGTDLTDLATTFVMMDGELNQFAVPMMHEGNWAAAKQACPELWPDDVTAYLEGYGARIPQILEGIMGTNTLIHNDYRVDNLLWDGDEVVVLDFQLSAVAHGIVDFTFLVAQSLPTALRQERFDDLLDIYLGELAANGVELDRDTALDKYRRALVFGFMWPLGMMPGYENLEPRSRQLANTMLDRHLSAVRDADALSLYL
jgi:hypothetical protein